MVQGLIGRKIGMTQIFRDDGQVIAVTGIEAGPCFVTQVKTKAKDGYDAVQLGFGEAKRLNSPEKGHLKNLEPLKYLREFKITVGVPVEVGQKLDVTLFKPGDLVDIIGLSKGRGFAGVVKRHHFAGGPKTHGQSDRHRAPGSIGSTTSPGRVLKGLSMAGHMGNSRVTVRNLEVIEVQPLRNLLLVKGGIPGTLGNILFIRKAKVKKR